MNGLQRSLMIIDCLFEECSNASLPKTEFGVTLDANASLGETVADAYGAAEGVDVVAPRGHEVREYSVGVSERGGIGAVGSGDAECSDHVFWQSANDGWKPEKFA